MSLEDKFYHNLISVPISTKMTSGQEKTPGTASPSKVVRAARAPWAARAARTARAARAARALSGGQEPKGP